MVSALEQQFQQIRGRIQAGPAGKFYSWWVEELKLAMPESWQARLQHAQRRVYLQLNEGTVEVGVDDQDGRRRSETITLAQDPDVQRQQVDDVLEANDLLEISRFLFIDQSTVLSKDLLLPAAVESNLAQALGFEMDRQTPFRAADVYYDWKVLDRDLGGQLSIRLFLVPRSEVDGQIEIFRKMGIELSGIDVVDGDRAMGLNLLPADLRQRAINRKTRINLILAGITLVLLLAVMVQSLYLKSHQVAELQDAIAEVQGEARSVMRIKEQIADGSEAASFLARRRAESPLAIELLADITRLLPDDTYLDRLVINKDTVQLQGKSSNAQKLIELVNESVLLHDASFRGSTRLDARSGLEIFEVNAKVLEADES